MGKRYVKRGRPQVREETHPTWERLYIAVQIVVDLETKEKREFEGTSSESRSEAIREAIRLADAWIAEQEGGNTSNAKQGTSSNGGEDQTAHGAEGATDK
jgi:hypothetical protein